MKDWEKNYRTKAVRWGWILGGCPGVRAVFLSGSLARGVATEQSDIDIFIIARAGQIWTARFFVFALLKLAGQLAKPARHAGRICPNHFVTDDALELNEKNDYTAKMFSQNLPLYDPSTIWRDFVRENQGWVRALGYEFQVNKGMTKSRDNKKNWIPACAGMRIFKKSADFLFQHLQVWKIKHNPAYKIPGACIVLSDTELRFHPIPKAKY